MNDRRRGFALADFIAGSVILAGAVAAWVAVTRAQIDAAGYADRRITARNAALRALDDVRLTGVGATAAGKDWKLLKAFGVTGLPAYGDEPIGRLEFRELSVSHAEKGTPPDLRPVLAPVEVRARVRWRNVKDYDEIELSTVIRRAP